MRMRVPAAFVLAAAVAAPALAGDHFVAPDGKDSNPGTLAAPFASVQRAQAVARPGDSVFLRGGTYRVGEDQIALVQGIYAYVFDLGTSGARGNPIRFVAYRDERPVFDLAAVKPAGKRVVAFNVTGSWLQFRGFDVTGVQVTIRTHTQSECFENRGGSNNLYENLSMHDGMGIGFYLLSGSDNLVLNCDAYRNCDAVSEDGRGGNTDGFGCHSRAGSVGNVFRGCRAWFNSDDGYDCINSAEAVTFDHCWAMYNGFSPAFKSLGDGNGFKAGGYGSTPAARLPNPVPHHAVRFCLAVRNKAGGFYANHHVAPAEWLNDTAYGNGVNFNMLMRGPDNVTEMPGRGQVMRNNLGFKGRREVANLDASHGERSNNSFEAGVPVTAGDFVSLDEGQLVAPRQPNGDQPRITFMHVVPGGPLAHMGAFAVPGETAPGR